jgi:hypothetical protein
MAVDVVSAAKTLLCRRMFANATGILPKSIVYCREGLRGTSNNFFEEKLIDLIYHLSTSVKIKLPN